MSIQRIHCVVAWAALLLGAGCGTIDTAPASKPERVLAGAVNFTGSLPAGAEIVVRVIEPPTAEAARTAASDLPVAASPAVPRTARVLGETRQVLPAAALEPVPFEVEYSADESVLRRGLSVDVRISVGGKVRLRTISTHVITVRSAPFKQDVWVQPVQ